MAMNKDMRAASGWILDRMERDQDERRQWNEAAMAQHDEANAAHRRRTGAIVWMLALRPVIELAILITLIVKL